MTRTPLAPRPLSSIVLACAVCASSAALAGRPLAVDDANTNERGAGHVELWATHADGTTAYSLAPAYAPWDGVELGALVTRLSDAGLTATALQAKWRITPSQASGCNVGAVFGISRVRVSGLGSENGSYLNGLLTCNLADAGSLHLNAGASRPSGGSTVGSWGIAYEKSLGAVTPHVEWFGSEGAKPTVQVGARGEIAPGWQLDGSVGRSDGVTVTTLGLKFQF